MTQTPSQPVVWIELPVRDLHKSMAFYGEVLDTELSLDTSGPNPMALFASAESSVSGHLYPGTPPAEGSGPTVHFAVPDLLEDALDRCAKAGGKVKPGIIQIPVGRFAYANDIDGNSIGLFETSKG